MQPDVPSDPRGQRRFSEEEVGSILKRATELQVAEPSSTGSGGMTLSELEEIAAEAGIDARHLRRAALELESGAAPHGWASKLAGEALEISLEATELGELDAAGLERTLALIQRVTREHGHSSLLGQTLTWTSEAPDATRSTMIVVTARDGVTRVQVEERWQGLARNLFGGFVGGGGTGVGFGVGLGVGLGALGSALFATAFPIGTLGVAYVVARALFRTRVRERRGALTDLLERIRTEVAASLPPPPEPGEEPPALTRG
jgi:hypothetical protein